jgi:3-deoxy-D-manno-octulosonic-acid transferase
LADECLDLLQNAGQRQAMGEAAQQVAEANRGALSKLLAIVECQLPVNPCS